MIETLTKDIAFYLGGLLVALLQIIGLWQIKRIDALEKGKCDKEDLATFMRVCERRDVDMIRREETAQHSRDAMHEKINKVMVTVARIEGRQPRGSADS